MRYDEAFFASLVTDETLAVVLEHERRPCVGESTGDARTYSPCRAGHSDDRTAQVDRDHPASCCQTT